MRLVFISDTHSMHPWMTIPEGDILFHAGDFSKRGRPEEVRDFLDWYAALPHPVKIFIAGNHDFMAERDPEAFRAMIPDNLIYLEDSGTTVEGLRIWGSPIQPWFFDWAFNRERGAEIRAHWDLIPLDTDILLTHGPPYGILDQVLRTGHPVGCRDLGKKIKETAVKIHAFGHIHEAYGTVIQEGVQYINASMLDVEYRLGNKAWIVELG